MWRRFFTTLVVGVECAARRAARAVAGTVYTGTTGAAALAAPAGACSASAATIVENAHQLRDATTTRLSAAGCLRLGCISLGAAVVAARRSASRARRSSSSVIAVPGAVVFELNP